MIGQDFFINGRDFHDDVYLLRLNSEAQGDDVATCLWPIHPIGHKGCCNFLVVFGENGFIVKTNRGIVWSDGLLFGTWWWVLIRKNGSLGGWRGPRFIFFLVGPLDVLELLDYKRGVFRIECGLEICGEIYSKVL